MGKVTLVRRALPTVLWLLATTGAVLAVGTTVRTAVRTVDGPAAAERPPATTKPTSSARSSVRSDTIRLVQQASPATGPARPALGTTSTAAPAPSPGTTAPTVVPATAKAAGASTPDSSASTTTSASTS